MTPEPFRNDSGAVLALACARGSRDQGSGIREHGSRELTNTSYSPLFISRPVPREAVE